MENFGASNLLPVLIVVLAGTCISGCGDAGRVYLRKVIHSTSASIADIPTQTDTTGDYDSDDYANGTHYDDADNDDNVMSKDGDNDTDNRTGTYYDRDDNSARGYGHMADARDGQSIRALVKRYYDAAARQDGAAACSIIVANVARAVPMDLGRPPGPPYLHGSTCPEVMSKILKQNRGQLTRYAAALKIIDVRVNGDHALAILGFNGLPGRQLRFARENHTWRLEVLLDRELP
jgi:hypothetical protein